MSGKSALPANYTTSTSARVLGRYFVAILLCFAALQLQASKQYTRDEVIERGSIHVIGVAGPTTFLPHGNTGARGLQYELLREFADQLNLTLIIEQAPNAEAVIHALQAGDADIGITGLASDDPRLAKLQATEPYLHVTQQLIQRAAFDNTHDATVSIAVGKNSAEAQTLAQAQPHVDIVEVRHATPDQLLAEVNAGDVDYAVVNDAEFTARRAVFPQLKAAESLQRVNLAWSVPPRNTALLRLANRFLRHSADDGTLQRLTAFYGQGDTFNAFGVKTFQRDMQERLPLYKSMFQQQADKQAMDWRLLAAIGYQESKWNSYAVSPTGVTGLMMLTRGTAKEMGVTNLRSPQQSIQAGAAYYKIMTEKLPDSVREPDRTWMALAAYNMGYRHVLTARKLAVADGDDPNKWLDVSRHLKQLPRSGQALVYVQEVRRYYDALLLNTGNQDWVASLEHKWVVTQ